MTDRIDFVARGRRSLTDYGWSRVMTFAATAPVADVERAAKAGLTGRWDRRMTRRDAVEQLGVVLRLPRDETSTSVLRGRGVAITHLVNNGILKYEWAFVPEEQG